MAKTHGRLYLRRVFLQGVLIGLCLVFGLTSLSFIFRRGVPPEEKDRKDVVSTMRNDQDERPKLLAFVGVQVEGVFRAN